MKDSLKRIEKLLTQILIHKMQDAPQSDKALVLNNAGFSNVEIAASLGTTTAVISQQLYASRKTKIKKKTAKCSEHSKASQKKVRAKQ
jgi:transcriptional regulator